jgi:hypothetical protein
MMTTTLRNNTQSSVALREGQVGVLRKVCEIPPGGEHKVRSNLTATYKEYWCALQPSNDHDKFILTSDDCIDWKEIEITSTDTVPKKFLWKGTIPAKGNAKAAQPGSPCSPSSGAAPSSIMSKLRSKFLGWAFKEKPSGN